MKLNIFKVPRSELKAMRDKFAAVSLVPIHDKSDKIWDEALYFSKTPNESIAPWIGELEELIGDVDSYATKAYFGAYVIGKKSDSFVYVLSYGKCHFYIRPFADFDFGIELAKRIANENDVKQTSSRRFSGVETKKIKSYRNNSRLDVESGASLDYMSAKIIASEKERFGLSGKFGMSALLSPDVFLSDMRVFLSAVTKKLGEEQKFAVPRTEQVKDEDRIKNYRMRLIEAINNPLAPEFNTSSYDLVGVDFVFSGQESYTFYGSGTESEPISELSLADLKKYIDENDLSDEDIFKTRIRVKNAEGYKYSKGLLESLDFSLEDEKIILSQGRWLRFNEDYINQLNDYVSEIKTEIPEGSFNSIAKGTTESAFNASAEVHSAGYTPADKDFDKLKVRGAKIPTEAWDLYKEGRAYAVKFGKAQKLGYVCDQGMLVMEVLRTRAYVRKFDENLESYCLWLGYEAKKPLENIAQSGSVILKQKIEAWARRCNEVGITPVLKISQIETNQ